MEEISSRPRVFVSSTIYDFRDLRSALKFWLEEMGCDVLMSEANDFDRMPDEGTFESCFNAISKCDYYVLLVGGRKGFILENGASVTQEEYRHAAELAKQGRIKPVVLVRSEVLVALRERDALGVPLNSTSVVMEDPEFTAGFLEEIKQTEFDRLGPHGRVGNMWYYSFEGFDDVVETLRVNLQLHRSIRRQAMLANLQWELQHNIAALLHKGSHGKVIAFRHKYISPFMTRYKPRIEEPTQVFKIPRSESVRFHMFVFGLPLPQEFRTSALQEAILSGEFLTYQAQIGRLVPGELYQGLQTLLATIERYRSLRVMLEPKDIVGSELASIMQQAIAGRDFFTISSATLVVLYQLHYAMADIEAVGLALLRHIISHTEYKTPSLSPLTPFSEEIEKIQAERVKPEEVENWVRQGPL